MKQLADAMPTVMGKIVLAVPLRDLLRLPLCEGGPAAKRQVARELRAQADRYDRDRPAVGANAIRAAATLLRELAADTDRQALELERAARAQAQRPAEAVA